MVPMGLIRVHVATCYLLFSFNSCACFIPQDVARPASGLQDAGATGGSAGEPGSGAAAVNASAFSVAQLPGSSHVLVKEGDIQLAPCTFQSCPYGEAGTASQELEATSGSTASLAQKRSLQQVPQADVVNRVPYMPSDVLVGSISIRYGRRGKCGDLDRTGLRLLVVDSCGV